MGLRPSVRAVEFWSKNTRQKPPSEVNKMDQTWENFE